MGMRLKDIRDGFLCLTQGKTGAKLRMAIEGELAALVERIEGRTYKVTSLALIRNEGGQPLSASALDNRFEDARRRAARKLEDADRQEAAAERARYCGTSRARRNRRNPHGYWLPDLGSNQGPAD